mgnify:CR=1 FL=1
MGGGADPGYRFVFSEGGGTSGMKIVGLGNIIRRISDIHYVRKKKKKKKRTSHESNVGHCYYFPRAM